MDQHRVSFSVFTKPWKTPLSELARFVRGLGFEGIELPVRPRYQVLPENVGRDLPAAARLLADHGLKVFSVAPPGGPVTEPIIAACAAAGVPVIVARSTYFAGTPIAAALAVGPGLHERQGWQPALQQQSDSPKAVGLKDLEAWWLLAQRAPQSEP